MSSLDQQTSLTAFFHDRQEADRAVNRLVDVGVPQASIRLVPGNEANQLADRAESHRGFLGALADFFMPDEDRYAYAEGLTRGGYLVVVDGYGTADYDTVLDILDDDGAVDFDETQANWRAEGWTGYSGAEAATDNATLGSSVYDQTSTGTAATAASVGTSSYDNTSARRDDETIPVVEESLKVGKRDVNLGRVRVRSYLREEPVSEQVNLRDEKVTLDRRPVDRAVDVNDAAFQDRTIEAEEHAEEAVVSKTARVVEEIGLHKESSERQETITDTIRKTEVEIEDERDVAADRVNNR